MGSNDGSGTGFAGRVGDCFMIGAGIGVATTRDFFTGFGAFFGFGAIFVCAVVVETLIFFCGVVVEILLCWAVVVVVAGRMAGVVAGTRVTSPKLSASEVIAPTSPCRVWENIVLVYAAASQLLYIGCSANICYSA